MGAMIIWTYMIMWLMCSVDAISLLSIKGNKFYDASGQQFFIKGIREDCLLLI